MNVGYFGKLVDVDTHAVGVVGVAPNHGIVANDAPRRVVECAQNRVAGTVANVQRGAKPLDFVGADDAGIYAANLVDFGTAAGGSHGAVGVG